MTEEIDAYAATADHIHRHARTARPLLAGFNTCVDQIHHLGPEALDRLGELGELGAELARRISAGRDGEVVVPAPELQPAFDEVLGPPRIRQVGGTGPQAAWALSRVGAPSITPLADRSPEQLSVLDPDIGIVEDGTVKRAGDVTAYGKPAKPPHFIVEYTAGTTWRCGVVPRSSRIIVRLADDGIERDEEFARLDPRTAGAGLISGMNGIAATDEHSHHWLTGVVQSWRDAGLPMRHLELAEYATPVRPILDRYAPLATSLGLSLAEVPSIGLGTDPVGVAQAVAYRFGLDRVCVHADEWSLVVHRDDPDVQRAALRTANLLAAARARHGSPTGDLTIDPAATFSRDLPESGPLSGGWRAEVVPTPYLARPAATIGLGDTFVAGLLLASCL